MLTKAQKQASQTEEAHQLQPRIDVARDSGTVTVVVSGAWNSREVGVVDAQMRDLETESGIRALRVDLSHLSSLDTAGAWLIERLISACRERAIQVEVTGHSAASRTLLEAVHEASADIEMPGKEPNTSLFLDLFASVGRAMYEFRGDFIMGMHIIGATIRGAQMKLGHGHALSPAAIVTQIDRMGVGAIPVVVLMSTIIGAIVAQQGAFQLRYFGAEIFVVDLVGILVLREIGVLLTAIMIAGRSGSAITAEIGSMKMREEVDALTVIGLNPVAVLVFPRLVALVIGLPLLTVIANFSSLAGAITVSWVYSGISPDAFIVRLRDAIDLTTYFAGLIKAPFMAIIIGVIASVEGLKVGGSAESLGQRVTASVVKAIFVVIVVDGLFAMFYAAIDF